MAVDFTVDVSQIPEDGTPTPLSKAHLTLPFGQVEAILENLANGVQAFDAMKVNATAESVEIAGGAVTITRSFAEIEAQGGAGGADDLDTITLTDGKFAFIRAASGSTITLKHGTDNVTIVGDQDVVLSGNDTALIFAAGSEVGVIGSTSAGGGGGGAPTTSQYLTMALDAGLDNERRLQANRGIALADGGANGDATLTHNFGAGAGIALASDVLVAGNSRNVIVQAESATTDDLIEITGMTIGEEIWLRADAGDTITVKHNAGGATIKIYLYGDADVVLDEQNPLILRYVDTDVMVQQLDENSGGGGGAFQELIASNQLGSNQASITISSIPNTYAEILIVAELRTDRAAQVDNVVFRVNADSGTNYAHDFEQVATAAASNIAATGQTGISVPNSCEGNTHTADRYGVVIARFLNYANTGVARHVFIQSYIHSIAVTGRGVWTNTANEISSIVLTPAVGTNFLAGSRYAVYGIGTSI